VAALTEGDNRGQTAAHRCARFNTQAEVIIANHITHIVMIRSLTHVKCISMNV